MAWIVVVMTVVLFGSTPLQAQTPSPAAVHIQTYYQQLMPTIQQAGQLSVRERDKALHACHHRRLRPRTMTRLAVGPAWTSFSAGQQAAVRDAFARFIIADYASQVTNYSGESFVVEPQTTHRGARWRRNRQDEAAAARWADREYQLSGPRRAGDRCLSQRNDQRSRNATRRIRFDHRLWRCGCLDQEIARSNPESARRLMLQLPLCATVGG